MKARSLSAALVALAASGCGATVVRSGLPPGKTAPGFDERWHAAFLFGAVPYTHRYDLEAICPEGWSELRLGADEFTFAAGLLTAFLYSPSRVTIICAAVGDPAPPPLEAYTPPTLGESEP
ncbi:MAG TPA: hypothetical protein VIM73_06080 [Polyangiaceae bacterium]